MTPILNPGFGVKDDQVTQFLVGIHERFPKMYNTWVWDLSKCLKSLWWMAQVEIWWSSDNKSAKSKSMDLGLQTLDLTWTFA